jgi:DnaJ-class molecular chaperone
MDVASRITYDLFGEQGLAEISKKPKPKGGDYRPSMEVNLEDFYNGLETVFSFRRGEICKVCKGTGDFLESRSGCSTCNGTGKVRKTVKLSGERKTIEFRCKKCEGMGKSGHQVCPHCKGQKI